MKLTRAIRQVGIATLVAFGVVASVAPPVSHAGGQYMWTGQGGDHSWHNTQNWQPQGDPGHDDQVVIAETPSGPASVDVPAGTQVKGLALGKGGHLRGDGDLAVSESFQWTGGDSAVPITLQAVTTTTISGGDDKALLLPRGRISNSGDITFSGAGQLILDPSGLENDGSFTMEGPLTTLTADCCLTPAVFHNNGSLIVTTSLQAPVTHAVFDGVALDDRGSVDLQSGGVLDLQIGPTSFADGVQVTGAGRISIHDRATATLHGKLRLGPTSTLEVRGDGTLDGSATLTGGGTFTWSAGTVAGNITVGKGDTLLLQGPDRRNLAFAARFTNAGAATFTGGGQLLLSGPAIFENLGSFRAEGGASFVGDSCCIDPAVFRNAGTVKVDLGGDNIFAVSNMKMTNSGTVTLKSGTLEVGGAGYIQTGGSTRLDGGGLTSTTAAGVTLGGGILGGTGIITGTLQNGATIDPGGPAPSDGKLTITGNYTQLGTGTLRADVKGAGTAGTDYDQLVVGGRADLAGKLAIETASGFTPKLDARLAVVQARSRTGTFAQLQNTQLANNKVYWVQYRPSAAFLRSMTSFGGRAYSGDWPPDTTVAKSPAHVLEAVNTVLRLSTDTGQKVDDQTLLQFFLPKPDQPPPGAKDTMFDPRVYYDSNASHPRLIVVAAQSDETSSSAIWLAVSRSADPTTLQPAAWCRYWIDGQSDPGTFLASWADYPQLGVGTDALVLTTNQFFFHKGDDDSSGAFTYAIVRVLDKLELENNASGGCPALPKVNNFQLAIAPHDLTMFSLAPVQHLTSPSSFSGTQNPVYLVSTDETTASKDNCTYNLWRVSNVSSGAPRLDRTLDHTSFRCSTTYNNPPKAPQKGSNVLLKTGDARIRQAVGVGDTITITHATVCNAGISVQACVRVVPFTVSQSKSRRPWVTHSQEFNLAGPAGTFLYRPGITVNTAGQTVVVYQQSSKDSYLSASWSLKDADAPAFGPPVPLTTGACSQTATDRTGDYTGAATNPADHSSFWIGAERTIMQSTGCVWETQVGGLTP